MRPEAGQAAELLSAVRAHEGALLVGGQVEGQVVAEVEGLWTLGAAEALGGGR